MTIQPDHWIGQHKRELETPCLVIDIDRLDSNLQAMRRHITAAGKALRPHAKTHKCSILAKRQVAVGAIGICAAKVSEAQILAAQGLRNILITGSLVTASKIERFISCLAHDPACAVVVESWQGARLLHEALHERHLQADVLLDIDIGQHRTGVAPREAFDLFRRISDLSALHLKGIQAYAGHIQHIQSAPQRREGSLVGLRQAQEVVLQLRGAGLTCEIFSGGGTGTYDIDTEIPELTELQAGSYALMDADYFAINAVGESGKFAAFQPALTLLTTVVSHRHSGFVTVDAGLKSIYQDGPAPLPFSGGERHYSYQWFGDEYGKLTFPERESALFKVGDCVELIVSHCDPTVNLHDCFFVTQNDIVTDVWPVDLRGCSQ